MQHDTGIYKITSPSGKFYIGSAVSIKRRRSIHMRQLASGCHHNAPLQRAFNRYGAGSLLFEVIIFCARDNLIEFEQRAIDHLHPEYNICRTAGSTMGIKLGPMPEEVRRKIGMAHKGRRLTKEARSDLSKALRGKKMPDGFAKRVSDRCSGDGNPFYGKKHSKETISKVSGENHHSSKQVFCLETGTEFGSIAKARDWLRETSNPRASSSPIIECCKGSTRYSKAYGYTWRYKEYGEVSRHTVHPDMLRL